MTTSDGEASTHVWFHSGDRDAATEARRVFTELARMQPDRPGPSEVWRSSSTGVPGETTTFFYRFDGDVEAAVRTRIAQLTALDIGVEVMVPDERPDPADEGFRWSQGHREWHLVRQAADDTAVCTSENLMPEGDVRSLELGPPQGAPTCPACRRTAAQLQG